MHCQYLQIEKHNCPVRPTYYKNSVFLICVIFSIHLKLQYSWLLQPTFIVSVLVKTEFFWHWTSTSRSLFNSTLHWNLKFYMFLFDTYLGSENHKLLYKGKKFTCNLIYRRIHCDHDPGVLYLIQDSFKMVSLLWHGSDHRVLMRRCTFGATP